MSNQIKRRASVIFTGSNEFPFGSAVAQRQLQLARVILEAGYSVVVLNRRGTHSKTIVKREGILKYGEVDGIYYMFCTLIPFKPVNFVIRNLLKPFGYVIEFCFIFYSKLFRNLKFIFNNSIELNQLRYYNLLARLFRIELVYDYVEFVSSLGNRDSNVKVINSRSFDFQFSKYVDKVIVISTFLENHLNSIDPKIESIKIPPITDFSYFDHVPYEEMKRPYFLFCGSVAYNDIILFVIDSFKKVSQQITDVDLKLILNGSPKELGLINNYIEDNNLKDRVFIFSKIPYTELIKFYKNALALLIPIKNNDQDRARFPFKIAEYVASMTPLITTDVPLINEIFEDGYSAYIAKVDDSIDFSKRMQEVKNRTTDSVVIGKRAYTIGLKIFHYKAYIEPIKIFFGTSKIFV